MKLYALLIYNEDYKQIYSNYNLDDFFFAYRSKMKETIEIFAKEVIKNVKKNSYYKITESADDFDFTIYGSTFINYYIAITNNSYPQRVAFELLHTIQGTNMTQVSINTSFRTYQNPIEADKILQIKQEIDEAKLILLNSIDNLLDRGERMDQLLDKTEKLAEDSFLFRKKARDLNCCIIL